MEITQSFLTDSAHRFFGKQALFLNSDVLETALRYIAVKRCMDENGDIFPLSTSVQSCTKSVASERLIPANNITIWQVIGAGDEMPMISERGWVTLDKPPFPVATYLSAASATQIYLNEEKHQVIICVKRTSEKWITELSASLFRLLPWLYTEDKPLTEEEKTFFSAIHNRDEQTFNRMIDDLASKLDFTMRVYKKSLHSWGGRVRQSQIATLQDEIARTHRRISDSFRQICAWRDEIDIKGTTLNGLMQIEAKEDDALYEFFATHPQIKINSVDTSAEMPTATFSICDTIEFYDEESIKTLCESERSFVYSCGDETAQLFKGVFLAHKGAMRVESVFSIHGFSSLNVLEMTSGLFNKKSLRHPHLYHFGCLGGNAQYIDKYMIEGAWDMAIEQAISATKNINLGDATVMDRFIRDIRHTFDEPKRRYIIADNGQEMNAQEFLAYIQPTKTNDINDSESEGGNENG